MWWPAKLYYGIALVLMLVALIRERGARNYLEFCQLLGMCALWPITITLEIALSVANRRSARQAKPEA